MQRLGIFEYGRISHVSENPGQAQRRYRRRATPAQGRAPKPVEAPRPAPAAPATDPQRRRRLPRELGERGLQDLVGAGRSQLGVSGALRGRDVNRPTDDDLAEAEREITIVRRNWQP